MCMWIRNDGILLCLWIYSVVFCNLISFSVWILLAELNLRSMDTRWRHRNIDHWPSGKWNRIRFCFLILCSQTVCVNNCYIKAVLFLSGFSLILVIYFWCIFVQVLYSHLKYIFFYARCKRIQAAFSGKTFTWRGGTAWSSCEVLVL